MDMAATLVEELVEEILMRIQPEEPAHLVSAALVCKTWRRILSNDGFRRRCRRFHGTPPLLGYIHNNYGYSPRFIPTTSAATPVSTAVLKTHKWVALDCRHGRVLIETCYKQLEPPKMMVEELMVWNPTTGGMQRLSWPPYPEARDGFTASVLCATRGCDHLDSNGGPFVVVHVWMWKNHAMDRLITSASVYSSVTGAWSAPTSIDINCYVYMEPGRLIGDALYFTISMPGGAFSILKYDMCKHILTVIDASHVLKTSTTLVLKGGDRGLQLVIILDNCIYMWSQQDVTDNRMRGWVKHKVMELPALLLEHGWDAPGVVGFIEGMNIIFISTYRGIFTLNLKSRHLKRVGERQTPHIYPILPYMSFYTPR